jgi:hypothetical protein
MANNTGQTPEQILGTVQFKLRTLRAALHDVQDAEGWAAGIVPADLVTDTFTEAQAEALLSALADANALAQIYTTGKPPSSYPQPTGTPYVYANSQQAVIGP